MRSGKVVAQGTRGADVTCPLMRRIFDVDAEAPEHPEHGTPMMIPLRSATPAGSEKAPVV